MEGPIIHRSIIRKSKELKRIGKDAKQRYRGVRGRFPKARIQKMVELRKTNPMVDLTKQQEHVKKTYHNFLEAAQDMNIFGMVGSGYPAASKMQAVMESKSSVKYCIINAVECEPSLLQDEWLMNHEFIHIVEGVRYLTQWIPFAKVVLASKLKPKQQWIQPGLEYCQVPNRYPMGEEHLLIQHVLHREVKPGRYPAQEGILVMNVQTLVALAEAMQGVYPLESKYITVADLRNGQSAISRVQVGMNVMQVMKEVLPEADSSFVYIGDGAMSAHRADKDSKIDSHTGFIAYGEKLPYIENAKCRKCGRCSSKCPMQIPVHKVIAAVQKDPKADRRIAGNTGWRFFFWKIFLVFSIYK